ncbi:MAG: NAD(P)-binding protein [Bacteroidia bacterium]|nr:NAD(P)-binding protein [Bacteroidia bacterium]
MTATTTQEKETDYLIIGAGAMGIAFADEIFSRKPQLKITIIDRREKAGGHWNDAYPFVRLHQPAAFYGVNSLVLGNGSNDLSSKTELLAYYDKIMEKFLASGRVEFLAEHDYLGDGKVVSLKNPAQRYTYKINKSLVDGTYMKVEVPSTHAPKYKVGAGVHLLPVNELLHSHDKWEKFYVVGSGKTGMDAILFLLDKEVPVENIFWISPNDSWLFNRAFIQEGSVAEEVLKHGDCMKVAQKSEEIFLEMEKKGGILRLDKKISPGKWRCATVSPEELEKLQTIRQVIRLGRVKSISPTDIEFEEGKLAYSGKALFVHCSANGLAKRKKVPIFSDGKITLQSILFCQQVFSAATIARLSLANISEKRKNQLTPVPHPEYKEDWPKAYSTSINNLLLVHKVFPLWMFRSRLNFMSHEPMLTYFAYAAKAMLMAPALEKAAKRMPALH